MATKGILLLILVISLCELISADDVEASKSSDFTFNFYKKIFNKNENMVMCPMATRYLLGLIYQFSTGETENELRNILNFDTKANTLTVHNRMLRIYNSQPELSFINKFYLKRNEQINVSFIRAIRAYLSEYEKIDFIWSDANDVNNWISRKTHGKIESIISGNDFNGKSMLTLNSVYFRGLWKKPFDEDNTDDFDFTTSDGRQTTVNMMQDGGRYFYTHMNELGASILEIPYKESIFNFWIILPDENTNIEEVHKKLSKRILFDINRNLATTNIDLQLPRFDISTNVDVKTAIRGLGINKLFTDRQLSIFDGSLTNLEELNQKLRMTVDLNGTEIGTGDSYIGSGLDIVNFYCNRPFIFLVLRNTDNNLKEPIIVGHYVRPT